MQISYNKQQLSSYARSLLALHLFWVNNGYDRAKLKKVISTIRYENPFVPARLDQIVGITGKPVNNDFDLEELEKLTYLYPNLIFGFDGNLSFLKYCKNVVEVDFTCTKLVDISDFKYLENLVKAELSFNRIKSIEALKTLTNIEELMLNNSDAVSLAPLLHHKKINKIELNIVENEEDILNIISNQEVVSAQYLLENSTVLLGLSFPRYLVSINLMKDMLIIDMTSELKNKYGYSIGLEIPTEFTEDENFIEAYTRLLNVELDKRVRAVLKTNYDIIESEVYYIYEEIKFGTRVRIKKS